MYPICLCQKEGNWSESNRQMVIKTSCLSLNFNLLICRKLLNVYEQATIQLKQHAATTLLLLPTIIFIKLSTAAKGPIPTTAKKGHVSSYLKPYPVSVNCTDFGYVMISSQNSLEGGLLKISYQKLVIELSVSLSTLNWLKLTLSYTSLLPECNWMCAELAIRQNETLSERPINPNPLSIKLLTQSYQWCGWRRYGPQIHHDLYRLGGNNSSNH